jgi:RNA polymerase sigma factor (sigma-70 family)
MDAVDAYLADLARCPRFSAEEERALWHRMRGGDAEAKGRLVESVLPMAFGICGRGTQDADQASLDAADAVLRSLEYFDPDKGRLTTYTTYVARTQRIRGADAKKKRRAVSLDDDHEGEGEPLGRSLPDPRATTPGEPDRFREAMLREEYLAFLLAKLPEREREAVARSLRGEVLVDVARRRGLSRERIRQLSHRGIGLLQSMARDFPFTHWRNDMLAFTDKKQTTPALAGAIKPVTLADAVDALKDADRRDLDREVEILEGEIAELRGKIAQRRKTIRLLRGFVGGGAKRPSAARPKTPAADGGGEDPIRRIHAYLLEAGPRSAYEIGKHFDMRACVVGARIKKWDGRLFARNEDDRWTALPHQWP